MFEKKNRSFETKSSILNLLKILLLISTNRSRKSKRQKQLLLSQNKRYSNPDDSARDLRPQARTLNSFDLIYN